ncbi:MAG: M23 family metallopeptidase [Propionibacteriaceae bacterium]
MRCAPPHGGRDELIRWATTAAVTVAVAVIGLIAVTVAPLGMAPGPTPAAAADGYLEGYRSTSALTEPTELAPPPAFSKNAPPRSSRDRARAAALAANRQAERSDTLIADTAERLAADQVQRETNRVVALSSQSKASSRAARAALTAKIAAAQRAKLAAIRVQERAKAGLPDESSGATTDNAPVTAAAGSAVRTPPGMSPSTVTGPTVASSSGAAASPITNGIIGARFGAVGMWSTYHTGVDYRAAFGTPIHAAADGEIVVAGNTGDWSGNHVAIRHADGTTTMYSHMSSMNARVGEQVGAGQVIGYVGSTGRAFGAHLHFEVYPPGVTPGDVYRAINPLPWLAARGVRTG